MQSTHRRRRRLLLLLILVVAAMLRLSGLDWGLPSKEHPAPDYFHPDEFILYEQGQRIFDDPDPIAFAWGGALSLRAAHLARGLVGSTDPDDGLALRRTMLFLRALNVLYALLTILLIAHIGRVLFGNRAGLLAAALFAVFPGHVLDCHYARPDVLATLLLTASLAASVQTARSRGFTWLLLGALLAGLATSALLWGLSGFAGVLAAGALASRGRGFRHLFFSVFLVALSGIAGYLLGSAETLIYLDTFQFRLAQSAAAHRTPWAVPLLYLGPMTFFSCGVPAVLLAWSGLIAAVLRRVGPALVPAATALFGYALLGSQHGAMMRYVVWITPVIAIFSGFGLAVLGEWVSQRGPRAGHLRVFLEAAAILFTLQLSASYVLPMGFGEDPRRAVARRISAEEPQAVGVTASFRGDRTYQPRFSEDAPIKILELRLFEEFDPEVVLKSGPPWIITSDFARQHTTLESARDFELELRLGSEYEEAFRRGPPWQPLRLATLLGFERPDDLLYVRLCFIAYRRTTY